jgi:DnaJ-class molecular chaperone
MPSQTLPKCKTCDGQPWAIQIKESTMYACGYVKQAIRCPDCHGTGKKPVGRVRAFLARVGVRA